MDWLRKLPTPISVALIVVAGVVTIAVIGGYIALSLTGQPTDDFTRFVNTMLNALFLPIGMVGTTASIAAARSASKAQEQTNGGMKEQIKQAVIEAHQENGL